mmetsp:Transcript_6713/g.12917  ORF Transcript_6713/g.12917 Transcript_6713/m.12917 type:complete len:98 (-) Transcript_6713:1435-1728(-)
MVQADKTVRAVYDVPDETLTKHSRQERSPVWCSMLLPNAEKHTTWDKMGDCSDINKTCVYLSALLSTSSIISTKAILQRQQCKIDLSTVSMVGSGEL